MGSASERSAGRGALHARLRGSSSYGQLVRARDRQRGGGGQLHSGSAGRSVFDIVAVAPEGFELHEEETLRVDVASADEYEALPERSGFWLRARTREFRSRLPMTAGVGQPLVTPSFAEPEDVWLPADIGRSLSTLVATTRRPFAVVRFVRGSLDLQRYASRAEWEDSARRAKLLASAAPPVMGPPIDTKL